MNNDLISREALKELIDKFHSQTLLDEISIKALKRLIDNAPTIEIDKLILIVAKRHGKRELILNALRPHGEWVLNKDGNPECQFCHHSYTYWGNFCGNCGAKLKGGAE